MRFITAIIVALVAFLAISTQVWIIQKCGWNAFFLGDGALYAALSGMCDNVE